jgi:hypothetical protein
LKLVALGVLATIGLQALINLAVVTGLGPTKGIALPLLSSGGTGWILTAASLGLVIAMDRTRARAGEGEGVEEEPEVVVRVRGFGRRARREPEAEMIPVARAVEPPAAPAPPGQMGLLFSPEP